MDLLNESVNYKKNSYSIVVTYFQEKSNEIDNLIKVDEIKDLFGYHLKVCDQLCHVTNFSYDFVGEQNNILQFTVDIEYQEFIPKRQKENMNKIILRTERGKNNGNA